MLPERRASTVAQWRGSCRGSKAVSKGPARRVKEPEAQAAALAVPDQL